MAGAWDRRALLTAGLAVFVAGMIVQATGPDFAAVAAGRVLAALGAAGYQATAYSTAGILSDDTHRARSLAIVAGGSSVALVAGLPFGILVGQTWDWRAAMWVLVALAVLSALAVWRLPPAHAPRLSLRERGKALADPRVLGILAGTVTVLTPVFLIIAYLPAIMRASGTRIVIAILAYGAGQVTGTILVPHLIRRRAVRTALICGACGITAATAVLTATHTTDATAAATVAALGFFAGLTIVPQQHRLFAAVPKIAPVAVGLNGSGIYIATALGAVRRRGSTRHRRQRRPHHHRSPHRPARHRHRHHNRPQNVSRAQPRLESSAGEPPRAAMPPLTGGRAVELTRLPVTGTIRGLRCPR